MSFRIRSYVGLALLGAGIASLSAGCGEDAESSAKAAVRVLHLSYDAPAVDVFADGSRVAQGLTFQNATEYLTLDAGERDFAIAPAGQPASMAVLSVQNLNLAEDSRTTLVAYRSLASIAGLVLTDNLSPPAAGKIRVRAIHAAQGVGPVDIWNIPATGQPTALYTDVALGTAGNYLELPAGSYKIGFDVDKDLKPDLVFVLPTLPEGSIANLFAVKDAAGSVFLLSQLKNGNLTRVEPEPVEPGETFIRVLHLSPDAPEVDVLVNGSLRAVTGLAFLEGTDYLPLEPSTYNFSVVPVGGSAAASVLDINGLTLEKDKHYTAVAIGPLASIEALALVDDNSNLAPGNIRVRAIHAASAVGEVDIWNVPSVGAPGLLYENVPFGAVGNAIDLPAGAYTLGFDVDNNGVPDLTFSLPNLAAGTVTNVFAVSDSLGKVFLLAQLAGSTVTEIEAS